MSTEPDVCANFHGGAPTSVAANRSTSGADRQKLRSLVYEKVRGRGAAVYVGGQDLLLPFWRRKA